MSKIIQTVTPNDTYFIINKGVIDGMLAFWAIVEFDSDSGTIVDKVPIPVESIRSLQEEIDSGDDPLVLHWTDVAGDGWRHIVDNDDDTRNTIELLAKVR